MSLESMLEILTERGLSIRVDLQGQPRIVGRKGEITEGVREVLAAYREEIIARFRPKSSRRIVLLREGDSQEIERILEENDERGQFHERVRQHAEYHPGRTVAGEWRQHKQGHEEWVRFLWLSKDASEP